MSSDNPEDRVQVSHWKPKTKGRRDVRKPKVKAGRENPSRKAAKR